MINEQTGLLAPFYLSDSKDKVLLCAQLLKHLEVGTWNATAFNATTSIKISHNT